MSERGVCSRCGSWYRLKKDGTVRKHRYPVFQCPARKDPHPEGCPGSGELPVGAHLGGAEPKKGREAPEKRSQEPIWLLVKLRRWRNLWSPHLFEWRGELKDGKFCTVGKSLCGRIHLSKHRPGYWSVADRGGRNLEPCAHCIRVAQARRRKQASEEGSGEHA